MHVANLVARLVREVYLTPKRTNLKDIEVWKLCLKWIIFLKKFSGTLWTVHEFCWLSFEKITRQSPILQMVESNESILSINLPLKYTSLHFIFLTQTCWYSERSDRSAIVNIDSNSNALCDQLFRKDSIEGIPLCEFSFFNHFINSMITHRFGNPVSIFEKRFHGHEAFYKNTYGWHAEKGHRNDFNYLFPLCVASFLFTYFSFCFMPIIQALSKTALLFVTVWQINFCSRCLSLLLIVRQVIRFVTQSSYRWF